MKALLMLYGMFQPDKNNEFDDDDVQAALKFAQETVNYALPAMDQSFHLILGNNGSAKSLLINLLAGCAIEKSYNTFRGKMMADPIEPIVKTSYGFNNCTTYPTLHRCAEDLICCDSLGFNSFFLNTNPEDKTAMALSFALMTQFAHNISGITIMITEDSIKESLNATLKLFSKLNELFKVKPFKFKNSIQFIIVSHRQVCQLNDVRETFFQIRDSILDFNIENNFFIPNQDDIVNIKIGKYFSRCINDQNVNVINPLFFDREQMLEKFRALNPIPPSVFNVEHFHKPFLNESDVCDVGECPKAGLRALHEAMLICFNGNNPAGKQAFLSMYNDLLEKEFSSLKSKSNAISLPSNKINYHF